MAGTAALGLALAACGSEDTGSDATDEPSASESSSETTSEDAAPAADYTNDACANDASVSDTFKAGGILPLTGNLAFSFENVSGHWKTPSHGTRLFG